MKPLNSLMAVLAIASVGALPLRTLAADGDKTTPAAAPASHPVDALAAIMKENGAARKAAGDRIAEFVLNGSGGKKFLGAGTNSSVLGTNVREWADKPGSVGDAAMVYFVLGPGKDAPGWANKSFASKEKHALWESRLVDGLKKYTEGDGQIQKDMEQPQLTAFLLEAVKAATTVFGDARSKNEIDLSVTNNDTTGVVAPDTRNRAGAGAGTRLDGPTRAFTMDDLYGKDGAVVVNVAGPKDANSRTISMKIYTKRLPSGEVVNEIGIFDITDRNDIFGQRFPLTAGTQKFALDDRTPGHKNYELSFGVADKDGNRTIKFARPGGGSAIETSVSDLFMKRADQASSVNSIINVGGQDFYVLPQGGSKGALMMFPKDMIDNRQGTADARNLRPSLFAYTNQRGAEGRDEIIPNPENSKGGPMLGMVGDQPYHLEFNKALGIWEAKKGEGDLPPAPPKPAPAGPATDPNAPVDPANPGTGPGNGGGTTPDTGAGQSIADLEALLLATPVDEHSKGCKKFPADNADLAANLRGKYSIVTCENDTYGVKPIILVPKSELTPVQQLSFPGVKRARLFDHYVVLQFETQVQYLDLLKPNGKGFDRVGFVDMKARNASDFTDMAIFIDALKNYMGISETSSDRGAFTAVPERVKNAVGTKSYSMTGMIADGNLVVTALSGGNSFMVWPKNQPPGGAVPEVPTEPYAGISGTTNAMDGTVVSADAGFEASFETADHYKATLMDAFKAADIALYDAVDLTGKDKAKRYFMIFKYKGLAPKDGGGTEQKVFRQKPFEIFNSTNPLPGDLKVQGLTTAGATVQNHVQTGYRFISKSTKAKGVLAVFQNRSVSGENVREKADNCVGPIAWWGVDRAAAQKACEEDKL